MKNPFKWIGSIIADGAIDNLPKKIPLILDKLEEGLKNTPFLKYLIYFDKAYDSMTDEERIEFTKNMMIAGAKLAVKF